VIDMHAHILPGLDDGPATMAESVALARAALAQGTRVMLATPHLDHRHRIGKRDIDAGVVALRARLGAERIPLEIRAGAEIALSRATELGDDALRQVALGDGSHLLVESPRSPVPGPIVSIILDLIHRGHGVLLAHPERAPAFQREPRLLRVLVERGALLQVTARSLSGACGRRARRFALLLIEAGLVQVVASDAHDTVKRPPGAMAAFADAETGLPGVSALREWLTELVPAAILRGEPVPARPRSHPRIARMGD
jgi:protein-tyrosine phosphatase